MSERKDSGQWLGATGVAPTFVASAKELLKALANNDSEEATAIKKEAAELIVFFESWPQDRPTNESRVAAIQRLLEITRQNMNLKK